MHDISDAFRDSSPKLKLIIENENENFTNKILSIIGNVNDAIINLTMLCKKY